MALRGSSRAPPSPDAYGVRVRESALLADPAAAVRRALHTVAPRGGERNGANADPRRALVTVRRRLAYRTPGSLVASFALHEAWVSCLQQGGMHDRDLPPAGVAEC